MDLDTFIDYLYQKDNNYIRIFVSYDKYYAEMLKFRGHMYLNVAKSEWNSEGVDDMKYIFPGLKNILEPRDFILKTSLNPYHYSVIHTNYIYANTEQLIRLRKIIEDVYDKLPSKVDIHRYKNDYDLYIIYNR